MKRPLRVLVTGASRGIGAAIADAFEAEGARVARNSRREGLRGDVGRDAARIVREAARSLGGLDVLVNNAGVSDPSLWGADLGAVTRPRWDRVMATDLRGAFEASREAAKRIRKGAIVNVASIPALRGEREGVLYAIAKAGVLGMTRALAANLAPRIRVNAMAFGSMETGWTAWLSPEDRRAYEAAIPLGRFGRPEEAGQLAVFLATNPWVTGQAVVLDGGELRA
jgi:3-oxoacyl-[acyl-carrier protein] reductase